jgi:hypothetical protein
MVAGLAVWSIAVAEGLIHVFSYTSASLKRCCCSLNRLRALLADSFYAIALKFLFDSINGRVGTVEKKRPQEARPEAAHEKPGSLRETGFS